MSAPDPSNDPTPASDPALTLHHTTTGGRRHLRQCPHLVGASPVLTAAADDTREICVWSQNELAGTGRTYHNTLAEALEDLGAAHGNRAELTRLLSVVDWDQVFVPYSRTYLTVLRNDRPVAWAGKTFVDYPDRPAAMLPDFVGRDGAEGRNTEGAWGPVCPECKEERSLSGACSC